MDPEKEHEFDRSVAAENGSWSPHISEPFLLIGHSEDRRGPLPPEIQSRLLPSNCNVAIMIFEGRLFLAWRTARVHWPTDSAKLLCMSLPFDPEAPLQQALSGHWELEFELCFTADLREPYFYVIRGALLFTFFKGNEGTFVDRMRRMKRTGLGQWTDPQEWAESRQIIWQYAWKPNDGRIFASGYTMSFLPNASWFNRWLPSVQASVLCSEDGETWVPAPNVAAASPAGFLSSSSPLVGYPSDAGVRNGAGEFGIAFDLDGDLWAVGRNEFGDASGWGSKMIHATSSAPGSWQMAQELSDPRVFQSCRLFRFGGDIYMISRNDPDGPYWWTKRLGCLSPNLLEFVPYHVSRSLRRTQTVLSHVKGSRASPAISILRELPGCGDTAFPSILRVGRTRFLVANYSSPLEERCTRWPWIRGQFSSEGTQIHLYYLDFTNCDPSIADTAKVFSSV